jgi:hypothetical protein
VKIISTYLQGWYWAKVGGEWKKEACSICIMTLKKMQKIVGFQNVPDLDVSNSIPKGVMLTDRVKSQRVYMIGQIESDVTE